MDDPVTPDNTRVLKIVDDFREFMRSSNLRSGSSTGIRSVSLSRGTIPFNMPEGKEEISISKRLHSTSEALASAKIAEIESKHASDERAHKMAKLDLEGRNEKLISENKLLKEKSDRLQLKVKQVTMQAIEAQDKLREFQTSRTSDKEDLEEMLLELQKDKEAQERDLQLKIDRLQNENEEMRKQHTNFNMQIMLLKEKLEEATTLLTYRTNQVEKLSEDLKENENYEKKFRDCQIKIQDLEMRLSHSSEAEQMSKVMKDDLERLRLLELEVVKLRNQNETYKENEVNVGLMKEKLLAMESKLERNDKLLEKATIVELENKELQAQLNEAKGREICNFGDKDLMAKVTELQQKEVLHAFEKGEMHAELMSCKKKCEALETSIKNLEETINEKTESANAKDTQIRHLQKRALLLAGERNSLRSILQSYDSELTTTSHADQLVARVQNVQNANEKVHARLVDIEKEAQSSSQEASQLKLKVKKLEGAIAMLKKMLQEKGGGSKEQQQEIEDLRKKIEDLEKDRSEMQKEKERLELWVQRNLMRGDYDPAKTKVMHFKMNPADLAHKQSKVEVAELRAKCIKLQEKLIKLEANQDITTTDIDLTQNKEFKEKLTAAELKNQRLKEVFSKRIQEFRQACYTLTGFRIDYTGDTQFKLVSMYAEKETDYLLFKTDSSGTMQLLETDYSKTLKNMIELHLHHQNSIPMFLSSITADLFSQQTMVL